MAALAVCACGSTAPGWDSAPASPGAVRYEGAAEAPLDERLNGRLSERRLRVLGERVELLPAGVDWAAHLAWRDAHAGGMTRRVDRAPEPDAPVLMQEDVGGGRTLFVIARSEAPGAALVVLTALARPL